MLIAFGNKNRAPGCEARLINLARAKLFFFFFAFSFGRATLFGCGLLLFFFHLLADFFLALGADFGALGPLGFDHFLAAHQLNEHGRRIIAFAEALVQDAQVATVAVAHA